MSAAAPPDVAATITAVTDWRGIFSFVLSNVVMYNWDFLITLDDEVEYIWKRKLSFPTVLFLINRYFMFLGNFLFVITVFNINNLFSPESGCIHAVLFQPIFQVLSVIISEILMTMRVYVIYHKNIFVVIFLGTIMAAQIAWSAVIISGGEVPILPAPLVECLWGGNFALGKWSESVGVIPLIFDTSVLTLTLARAFKINHRLPIMKLIVHDGILYFAVIFSSNFTWVMMSFFAPVQFQQSLGPWSAVITVIMVSRLVINLRKGPPSPVWRMDMPDLFASVNRSQEARFTSSFGKKSQKSVSTDIPLEELSRVAALGEDTTLDITSNFV